MSNQDFQLLKELPTPFHQVQCVLHKHELIICGGKYERACYFYHTIENEYKFICDYPSDVQLYEHCVVKLKNNNNDNYQITLLSFGGSGYLKRHTLMMKYIALIGGSNNNLLFITYPNNISVFDLNTFQFIKHDDLVTDHYHCFVSNSKNIQRQQVMKTNKKNNKMILFCKMKGLSIECDEGNNTFEYRRLLVYDDIKNFHKYAYVHDIYIIGGEDNRYAKVSTHMKTKVRVCDISQLVIICLFIILMKYK
ncbi:hypothetical protein RFI_03294 [Reticulomyxa filosa]|uniref:Uncharacterized protein n=1 Tax=Reticulomyxa filosa TaxID=46433 RepID=X6P6R7_RETFI|nr:hypothetical protein RFI_03294 [Reticulomyxa filosa]|eukprot:ETO33808.1 hypothetical protein RFI_03294 [Reticulomyxa filosa]